MIIFKDLLSDNEIISDVYKLIDSPDSGDCLWEVDGQMVKPGQDSFVLEGANASAEGEDADDGDAGGDNTPVLNFARDFRYNKLEQVPSSTDYTTELKKYLKNVMNKLKEEGKTEEMEAFKKGAPAAMKKLKGMHKDLDFYLGESSEPDGKGDSMFVVVNFRDDGVTPYAIIWKHGLKEMKV